MRRRIPPGIVLIGALILALLLGALCTRIAVDRPWLGVDLAVLQGGVVVERVVDGSPLTGSVGAAVLAIGAPGKAFVRLDAADLVEEPDALGDGMRLRRFFARQAQLDAILRSDPVLMVVEQGGSEQTIAVTAAPGRPVTDLPWPFWTQLFVGAVGWTLGAWVVTLRPRDAAAWMLLLSGLGLAMAAQAAAIYSTRELALDARTFGAVSRANGFGTLLFGIGMVTLFLIYPRRLVRGSALGLPAAMIGIMIFLVVAVDWPGNVPMVQPFVTAIMAVLLAAIVAQLVANRRDPAARAMLGWLGLSVILGAGGFVLTVIIPPLMGRPPVLEQSTAFLLFLIIYVGVALGVARYRLFDLADWSVGVLFYAIGVVLLLGLDALLIYVMAIDRLPALSLSLAAVCLIYLPLRHRLSRWSRRGSGLPMEELYRLITEIAQLPDARLQMERIKALWGDIFHPLAIHQVPQAEMGTLRAGAPILADEGRTLLIPRGVNTPAFRLDYAGQGGRLFSTRDVRQAATISHLLDDTLGRHLAYKEAVAEERTRINRDMHDNIGILLLSALHSGNAERKNTLIRQTLSDLREIVSNPMQAPLPLLHLIADLRAELGEAVEAAGVELVWEKVDLPDTTLPSQTVQMLRAFLREAVSNMLRHANARRATASVTISEGWICASLADDGSGFEVEDAVKGNGLENLRSRMLESGGEFLIDSSSTGTRVSARISLAPSPAEALG